MVRATLWLIGQILIGILAVLGLVASIGMWMSAREAKKARRELQKEMTVEGRVVDSTPV